MIRALIVDDETLAREALRQLLAPATDVTVVGEAANGPDAVVRIVAERPDLVFLDVQMPGAGGFEVLEQVASRHLPEVIFVTAFDAHALRAFDVQALDYLLKPVTDARFAEALARARRELGRGEARATPERLAALLDAEARAGARRIAVRDRDRFLLVSLDEVEWFRSAGNYVELHRRGRMHLARTTLQDLERRLDPRRHARIHRSAIVALDRVRQIVPTGNGDFEVMLEGGAFVPMSRAYRDAVLPSRARHR